MAKTSPIVQMLWTCTQKGNAKTVLGAQIHLLRRQLWLFEMSLPPAHCNCQGCLLQLWWQNEGHKCLGAVSKSRSLTPAAPSPLGILCFKCWTLSWSSLELAAFSACWLCCVGGILWERGKNIVNRQSYFQNNHFYAPLTTRTGGSFGRFRLVQQTSALVSDAYLHLHSESCINADKI